MQKTKEINSYCPDIWIEEMHLCSKDKEFQNALENAFRCVYQSAGKYSLCSIYEILAIKIITQSGPADVARALSVAIKMYGGNFLVLISFPQFLSGQNNF